MSEYEMGLEPQPGERTPPADEGAERSVIGAILLSKQALDDVTEAMRPADFYQPRNELILTAALALTTRGVPVDAVTVGDELVRTGRITQAGGLGYLHECTSAVVTPANAGFYAEIVASKAVMRRLVEAGTRIVQMGYASEGEASALVEHARAEVDGVSSAATLRDVAPIGSSLDELTAQLTEKPDLAPTPWFGLDRILGGFAPGRLYVIAARPGIGKSAIAAQIAARLARSGPVGFVSLEMGKIEILQRLVSMLGPVSLSALETHQMTPTDWNSYAKVAAPALRDMPLHVVDDLTTMTQVASFARTLHRQGQMQGLVIDYVQLLTTEERFKERHLEVAAITRACKQLAKALQIPVFLLSQLNRAGVARGKGKETPPVLTDLRESGSIEQDADAVILLHRESKKSAVLDMNVAKNRQGPVDRLELRWEGQHVRAVHKIASGDALYEGKVA